MRLIDHCPSCFSSTSSDEGNSDGGRKRKRKTLLMPLERYALLLFGGDKKIRARDYYSKFYASPAVQAKSFCAGKKYKIERKHKVKKRELFGDGLSKSYTTLGDSNIKGESHWNEMFKVRADETKSPSVDKVFHRHGLSVIETNAVGNCRKLSQKPDRIIQQSWLFNLLFLQQWPHKENFSIDIYWTWKFVARDFESGAGRF